MREGSWIVLDELNLAPPDVLEALNRVLDDNREVFVPDTQEVAFWDYVWAEVFSGPFFRWKLGSSSLAEGVLCFWCVARAMVSLDNLQLYV